LYHRHVVCNSVLHSQASATVRLTQIEFGKLVSCTWLGS